MNRDVLCAQPSLGELHPGDGIISSLANLCEKSAREGSRKSFARILHTSVYVRTQRELLT